MTDLLDVPAYLEHALAGLTDVEHFEPAVGGLLAAAQGLLGAESSYLLRRDGVHLLLIASEALPEPPAREVLIIDAGPEGRAASSGMAIIDRASASPFAPRPDLALAAVPIRLRGSIVGVLVATRPGLFVPSELRWLRILAQIAGVAMENAQLLRNERRRARYGETAAALGTIERVDAGPFCQRMAEVINEVMGADRTDVLLHRSALPLESGQANLPERAELMRLGRAPGGRDDASGRQDLDRLDLAAGGALAASYALGVPYRRRDVAQNSKAPEALRAMGMRSILAVPIPGDERPQGLLVVASRRPGAFNAEDASFLRLVAERVALLLRHAQVERERARTAARQEFLTIVSHELKTPVTVIKAYGEVLGRRAEIGGWPGQDRRIADRIQEQADKMLVMIEQLLDLRRLEAGMLTIELSRFDLGAVLRRAVESIQATTENHQLTADVPEELVVRADRRRIEEVVTNLLENAVKYSPGGGPIETTARLDADHVHLVIADAGIGIAIEDLERIFDRFYQVGAGTFSEGHLGLGLGLYIAQEIVDRHGGRIWAESTPGQGATFHVELPIDQPHD